MSRMSYLVLSIIALLAGDLAAAEHAVIQKNSAFSIAEMKINPGDSIVFKNDDTVPHNVFSSSKAFQFSTNVQLPGNSATVTFKQPGTVEVRCVIHPAMKLVVDVK